MRQERNEMEIIHDKTGMFFCDVCDNDPKDIIIFRDEDNYAIVICEECLRKAIEALKE
jgi:hypothetical protein